MKAIDFRPEPKVFLVWTIDVYGFVYLELLRV